MSSIATAPTLVMSRFLDPEGNPVGQMPAFAADRDFLVFLYRSMVQARTFDAKAVALQRTGRLGTYASSLGQEAIGTGIASAMAREDVLLPSFREHSAQLIRGVSPQELFLYWGGDERGNDFADAKADYPVCIPVASQFPHAAGVALALAITGKPGVAVAVAGDGATSKGDFYEALNLVGVWKLPAVFVINNNQWAISVPRDEQSGAETLAQKAVAAGIRGELVDGNDVIAVHETIRKALARAREKRDPTLVECVSYRLSDHTTADDASRYREDAEVSAHWPEEPIARLRSYLIAAHNWSKEEEETILKSCGDEIEKAAIEYLATNPDIPSAIFAHVFAEPTIDLKQELAERADG